MRYWLLFRAEAPGYLSTRGAVPGLTGGAWRSAALKSIARHSRFLVSIYEEIMISSIRRSWFAAAVPAWLGLSKQCIAAADHALSFSHFDYSFVLTSQAGPLSPASLGIKGASPIYSPTNPLSMTTITVLY